MKHLALCCCLLFALVTHADDELTPAERIGLEIGPDTTIITGPINDFGYPDHLRWLDAHIAEGVAPEENFWVLMWQAMGNLERSSPEFIAEVEAKLGIEVPDRNMVTLHDLYGHDQELLNRVYEEQETQKPWTRAEHPEIADWIDRNTEVLVQIHEACARPKAYSPLVAGEGPAPMIAVLLPHVQVSREAARLLCSRAMLRLGEGDEAGAWQDLQACYRLANHLGKGWTLIERLVGVAIRAIAHDPTCHWLSQSNLSAGELKARWDELAPYVEPISFADCVDQGERFMFIDTVLALQTGRVQSRELFGLMEPVAMLSGDGGGASGEENQMAQVLQSLRGARFHIYDLVLFGSDVNETLHYGNRMYDEFYRAMSSPEHKERVALLGGQEGELDANASIANNPEALLAEYFLASDEDFERLPARMMTGMLMPAMKACEEAQARNEGKSFTLQAAFAVKIAMAMTGEIPESLAEVRALGDAVPAIPPDPFTGGDLTMLEDIRGIVIYSYGTDGEDDLGLTFGDMGSGTDYDDQRAIITLSP